MIEIELKRAHIETALLFVNKKAGRLPAISGVHISATCGSVAVQATDGAVFCHIAYRDDSTNPDTSIILNAKDLASALVAFKGDTHLMLSIGDSVTLRGGKGEMTIGTIDGRFPSYTNIDPGKDVTEHNLLQFDMGRVIKASRIIDSTSKNPPIHIKLKALGALVVVKEAEFMICGLEFK